MSFKKFEVVLFLLVIISLQLCRLSFVLAEEDDVPLPAHVDVQFSPSPFKFEFSRKDALASSGLTGGSTQFELRISNLQSRPELSYMKELRWTLNAKNEVEARLLAQRLIQRFLEFEKSLDDFKELLLIEGILRSETKVFMDKEGRYYAIQYENGDKKYLTFNEAYKMFEEESPKHKNFFRTACQIGAVLGIGGIWYFLTRDVQSDDWDLDGSMKDWKRKFRLGDGATFDRNDQGVNYVLHPLKGLMNYSAARVNGFNSLEAFLFNFTASAAWEYLIEFREKVSINDMIVTSIGGSIIGEVFYQFGEFFYKSEAAKPTLANKIFARLFASPQKFRDWISDNEPRVDPETDQFGFPTDVWHEFRGTWTFGGHLNDNVESGYAGLGFQGEIINVYGHEQPGEINKIFLQPLYNEVRIEALMGESNYRDLLFYVKTTYFGYYRNSITRDVNENLNGYTFMVGLSSAHEHTINRNGDNQDWTGIVHILGSNIDMVFYFSGMRVRLTLDEYGDFAAVMSFAVDRYVEEGNPLLGSKDVLEKQKYYYAWGATSLGKLTLQTGRWELGTEMKRQFYDSIEGLSRFQKEKVTDDFNLEDRISCTEVWGAYLFDDSSFFQLGGKLRNRSGELKDIEIDKNFREYFFSFGHRF